MEARATSEIWTRAAWTSLLGVLLAAGLWLVPATADAALLVKSGFAHSRDGWHVSGDPRGGDDTPLHHTRGGNPGGFIRTFDSVRGGTMYWDAPDKFLGDQSAAFRGSLKFDLRVSQRGNQTDRDDIVLEGAGLRLVYDTPRNPARRPQWTPYVVPLGKAGWTEETGPDQPATRNQMRTALSDLDSLEIRAEYRAGRDSDDLDNPRLKSR